VWNAHNTVFSSKHSAMGALAVYTGIVKLSFKFFFKLNDLHISTSLLSVATDMSRDSIVDRHCLPVSALCAMPSTRVRHRRKFGEGFLCGVYSQRNNFELILKPRLHDTTCCQTGCQTGLTTG